MKSVGGGEERVEESDSEPGGGGEEGCPGHYISFQKHGMVESTWARNFTEASVQVLAPPGLTKPRFLLLGKNQ